VTTGLTRSDVDRIAGLDATGQALLVRDRRWFDRALATVRDGVPDGPSTGVPYLLKDLALEVAGEQLTAGSRFLTGHVSQTDSELVRRLRSRTASPSSA
jgi:amidase